MKHVNNQVWSVGKAYVEDIRSLRTEYRKRSVDSGMEKVVNEVGYRDLKLYNGNKMLTMSTEAWSEGKPNRREHGECIMRYAVWCV